MQFDQCRRIMQACEKQIAAILDRVDHHSGAALRHDSRRKHLRFRYRVGMVPIRTTDPTGAVRDSVVFPRNLSASGMAYMHRGFVYPGSEVRVVLKRTDGDPIALSGIVRACRHVEAMFHEVGVEFHSRLNPEMFCPADEIDAAQRSAPPSTPPARILFVSHDRDQSDFLRRALADSNLRIQTAPFIGAAIDMVKRSRFDLIVVDERLEHIEADEIEPAIRDAGHRGPVFHATAQPDPASPRLTIQSPINPDELCVRVAQSLSPGEGLPPTPSQPHSPHDRAPESQTPAPGRVLPLIAPIHPTDSPVSPPSSPSTSWIPTHGPQPRPSTPRPSRRRAARPGRTPRPRDPLVRG